MNARHLVLPLLLLLAAAVGAEELSDAKQADIRKLMSLSGTDAIGNRVGIAVAQQIRGALEQQVPVQKQQVLDIADEVLQGWVQRFAGDEELQRQLVGIYARNFSHQEVKDLIAFYQTELGQKVIRKMPTIAADSMRVGQGVAQRLVPELEAEMQRRFDEAGITELGPAPQ